MKPIGDTAGVADAQFVDSTPLLDDPAALRNRADADGYLFFRGLLPGEAIQKVRMDLLGVVEKYGWRSAGQDALGDGIDVDCLNRVPDAQMRSDIGVTTEAYDDVQRLESMHGLPHHPRLINVYRALFGREVFVHPAPHCADDHAAPLHDADAAASGFSADPGDEQYLTAWFSLGDCPREMGSLSVCRRSHISGYMPIAQAPGAGGIMAQLCPHEEDWVSGDFAAGDVLTFRSLTVHRVLKSQFKDRIRLSLDVRYQPMDEEVEARSLSPHCALTWEEIYAGWNSKDFQYYWRQAPLKMSPWDDTLLQPKRRIC